MAAALRAARPRPTTRLAADIRSERSRSMSFSRVLGPVGEVHARGGLFAHVHYQVLVEGFCNEWSKGGCELGVTVTRHS